MNQMFGERLTYAREVLNNKMTQRELGELVGVTENQIWRYENENVQARHETVARIAKELSVSADWLLGLIDDPRPLGNGKLSAAESKVVREWRDGHKYEAIKIIVED